MKNYKRPAILTLFLLSLAATTTCAQQSPLLDSLLTLLRTIPDDSNKVIVYNRTSYEYNYVLYNTELARRYVDSAQILSERLGYENGLAACNYQYGLVDMHENNYQDALRRFRKYIAFSVLRGDSSSVARALYCVGTIYSDLGDFDKALANQLRALRIHEAHGNQLSMASTLASIGILYWKSERYKNAIDSYRRANEIYKALDQHRRYGMGIQNLANVYLDKASYDSARALYTEALEIVRIHGSPAEVAYILGNLGDLYEVMGDYDLCLKYNIEALQIRRGFAQKKPLAASVIGVGHAYLMLNQLGPAEKYLLEGRTLAESLQVKGLLQEVYLDLANLYIARKDYKSAYHFSNLSNQWKDSIFREDRSKQLAELQTRYETSEKDKQIALLAKENELQAMEAQRESLARNAVIAGLTLAILLAGLIIYSIRQRSKNDRLISRKNDEIKEINYKQQLTELEMKALRAQVNPHFLFNCMNSINRMILDGDTENASLYLGKFSALMRIILENAEKASVSLDDELKLVESYIQLEALRLKGKIDYNISVADTIVKDNTYLPSMLLQPFVENAIWHGLVHKDGTEKGVIKIDVRGDDNRLLCTIEDNGVGRERARQLREKSVFKNRSMGIKITEERLRLLNKAQLQELVRVTDLKDNFNQALGTRVEINIPTYDDDQGIDN